jgi:hypothetical protein
MAKAGGLFHVSMIVSADALYAVTTAAASFKARDVQINPVLDSGHKSNGAADSNEARIPTWKIMQPWWAQQKQFNVKDAIAFGFENGINSKSAIYTAILTAMKDGWMERAGPGTYKVLPKLKQDMKGGTPKPTRLAGATQRHEVKHTDFVLGLIKRGNVTYKSIKAEFTTAGRVPRSIDGALGRLKEFKMIGSTGPGSYKLLAKGEEHLKSLT